MNIFYLDPDPISCAQYHCDSHVVKMVTEYAQLLSMAVWVNDPDFAQELSEEGHIMNPPKNAAGKKNAHYKHPCALWVQTNRANFDWLRLLAVCLASEYFYRYGHAHNPPRRHASFERCVRYLYSTENFPAGEFTPPPQAMTEQLRGPSAVAAYRHLYATEKLHLMRFTRRPPPDWLISHLPEPVIALPIEREVHVESYRLIGA